MTPLDPVRPRSLSVAVVLHEPLLGGATSSLLSALGPLERRGWSFRFWVPGRGPAEAELRRRGYEVAGTERLLRFSPRGLSEPPGPLRRVTSVLPYLRGFRSWLACQRADVIHANTLLVLPEVVTRPRHPAPVVLHVHETLPAGAKGLAAGALARRADAVVAVSEATAAPLRGRGLDPFVVYPGVEPPSATARGGNGRLVVGTIGTICSRKGSDLFLAASRLLRDERGSMEFRLIGEPVVGGERPWAERTLATAQAEGIVHRSGVEPYAELADWDVFVMPSRMDPCPLAVLEAMSMGVPVVGTRVGGIPEQLGSDGGLLVEPGDVRGLAAAVRRLADQPKLRAELGASGRRRVERMFTVEAQAEGLDRAYRAALARSSEHA